MSRDEVRGGRGGSSVSGYVHPRRRVSFNRGGRRKLFPRDEERKEGGVEGREGALKRGVAAVNLASDISAWTGRVTLGFKCGVPSRYVLIMACITFLTFVNAISRENYFFFLFIILIMLRGLERKGDSKNWTINYEVWLEVSSKYLIWFISSFLTSWLK